MILFVVDDGNWKVVNLTYINDLMIAPTTFLKSDKLTPGVGSGRPGVIMIGSQSPVVYSRETFDNFSAPRPYLLISSLA